MNSAQSRALLQSLGILGSEPEAKETGFDGGVREPAPPEPDPETDHNKAIAEMFSLLPPR
jgi:hypothetical protein